MRESTPIVVVRERAGVARGGRYGSGSLGPGQCHGSVGIQRPRSPLTAAPAENIELPVCRVGCCRRQDGVSRARIYPRTYTAADISPLVFLQVEQYSATALT